VSRSIPTERLLQNYMPIPEAGCWIWMGYIKPKGYGVVSGVKGLVTAHKLFYTHHKGPVPEGLMVLHKCDVRCCCNPDHLYVGDAKQNSRDAIDRGRFRVPSGEAHGNAKATNETVRTIRALAGTMLCADIAKRVGISRPQVYKIIHRQMWANFE